MLKSPSCACRWCITLICRIQEVQSRPHVHPSLSPHAGSRCRSNQTRACPRLWLAQRAGSHPGTLADPCKHVVKLGTLDPRPSQVWGGNCRMVRGTKRNRAQACSTTNYGAILQNAIKTISKLRHPKMYITLRLVSQRKVEKVLCVYAYALTITSMWASTGPVHSPT